MVSAGTATVASASAGGVIGGLAAGPAVTATVAGMGYGGSGR